MKKAEAVAQLQDPDPQRPIVRTHTETGRKALYTVMRALRANQRADREGKPAAAQIPVGAPDQAGIHLPLPAGSASSLAFLGQSLRNA